MGVGVPALSRYQRRVSGKKTNIPQLRSGFILLAGILMGGAQACAAGAPGARAPDAAACDLQCGADGEGSQATDTLPRYFTLELSNSELEEGRVTADGESVELERLPEVLSAEAQRGGVRGAAVVALPGVSSARVLEIFKQLSAAGFSHVLVSGLTGPIDGIGKPAAAPAEDAEKSKLFK